MEEATPLESRFNGVARWMARLRLQARSLIWAAVLSVGSIHGLQEFFSSSPEEPGIEYLSKMKNGPIANRPCILVNRKTGEKIHAELCLSASALSGKINGQGFEGVQNVRPLISSIHVRDGVVVIYLSIPQTTIELTEDDLCRAWAGATQETSENMYLPCSYRLKVASLVPKMIPDMIVEKQETIELRRVPHRKEAIMQ